MFYAIVVVIALILDQLLKYWTAVNIAENADGPTLIPGLLRLTNVHNTGAAFSFLEGARWFFVALCIVFAVIVIYVLAKNIIRTPGARWAAVIVLAGAVGNCVDRIVFGYVVDMLEFTFIRFPVFNLADMCITLGAIAFCIFLFVEKPKKAAPQSAAPAVKTAEPPAEVPAPAPEPVVPAPAAPAERAVPAVREQPPAAVAKPVDAERFVLEDRPMSNTESVMRKLVRGSAWDDAPLTPAAPPPKPAPAKPKPASDAADEYDLDSILAEFKDL